MSTPTPVQLRKLKTAAKAAAGRAYAPYSGFPVGAAVLGGSGKIFSGCNVENASYGLAICAERAAIFQAVASGEKRVKCVVVYTPTKTATAPCGACRQVIHEFGPDARVVSICDSREHLDVSLVALLPGAFGPLILPDNHDATPTSMKYLTYLVITLTASSLAAADTHAIRGVDPTYMNTAVSPAADFYDYANGAYNKTPIPGDYASYGVNQEIDERSFAILKDILETSAKTSGPEGSITRRVGDFYAAGMDEPAIEKEAHAYLIDWSVMLSKLRGRRQHGLSQSLVLVRPTDLQTLLWDFYASGLPTCFNFGVQVDDKNPTAMIAAFYQGGLGLPDRDYYFRSDAKSEEIRRAYVAHMTRMFELAGDANPAAQNSAEAVMALETKMAKASRTIVERRDPEKNYNKFDRATLINLAPGIDWEVFFREIDFPGAEKTVLVGQPEFLSALGDLLTNEPLDSWRAYLRWNLLNQNAPYLGDAFENEHFEFFGKTLSGVTELKPRWKRVLAAADNAIGEDLGQLYVKRAFSPAAKARAMEMVKFHLKAMRHRIETATWMSAATKAQAFRKIDTMHTKIGYPDTWRDYSSLHFSRNSYIDNVTAADVFEFRRQLNKLGKPVDHNEWLMTPQTNNAYYEPTLNEMCFPAGILQPPFFDEKSDDASNYGALASTIGHELTHGFDDQGRQYDAEGNLRNWWTEADAKGFQERAEAVASQYSAFEPLPGMHIDGHQTLGENIADVGGLRVSYEAYKLATAGKKQPTIDGLTPDQRFFIAFAQGWRTNQRPQQVRLQITSDVHSPVRWRVLGPVANLPEFYQAFNCPLPEKTWPPIW